MEWVGPQVTICYISVLKKPDKTQLDLGPNPQQAGLTFVCMEPLVDIVTTTPHFSYSQLNFLFRANLLPPLPPFPPMSHSLCASSK